jgi:hypothetical protein
MIRLRQNQLKSYGFTIVEIIIASSLALVLFQGVYHVFFSTLNREKVNEEFTESLLQARIVLLKLERELSESRSIIYPILEDSTDLVSSDFIVYKDRLGLLKTIYHDSTHQKVHLLTFDIRASGALVEGSLVPDSSGSLEQNKKQFTLGSQVKDLRFTLNIEQGKTVQFRIKTGDYSLIGGTSLLNG